MYGEGFKTCRDCSRALHEHIDGEPTLNELASLVNGSSDSQDSAGGGVRGCRCRWHGSSFGEIIICWKLEGDEK